MFTCSIAGIPFRLDCDRPLETLGLRGRFGPFAVAPMDGPGLTLTWQAGDPAAVPVGELLFDPGSIWRVYRRADGAAGWAVRIGYPSPDTALRATLVTDADWSTVTMVERLQTGPSLLTCGAGELLLRGRVLSHDGLVFHAAGLDDRGQGLLLVGHSGAGKSTQCGLWEAAGAVAMNDDRVAARLLPGGPVIFGTPWGGTAEIARQHQAPLRAIIVIEQALENVLDPLPPAEAAALLLPRTFLPYWDAGLMANATTQLHRLLDLVPIYRLANRADAAVVDLVRSTLG